MKTILVTGSEGFMGRNLVTALRRAGRFAVLEFDLGQPSTGLSRLAAQADLVFHLAGVNRPKDEREFAEGNVELTRSLCRALAAEARRLLQRWERMHLQIARKYTPGGSLGVSYLTAQIAGGAE